MKLLAEAFLEPHRHRAPVEFQVILVVGWEGEMTDQVQV